VQELVQKGLKELQILKVCSYMLIGVRGCGVEIWSRNRCGEDDGI
jgi:hypothetical protein